MRRARCGYGYPMAAASLSIVNTIGMQTRHLLSLNPQGLHRVAYQEWGERDNPRVIICVHGLARNSRDFDDLARALAKDYRVICPDIVGRGQSDWLPPGSP